MTVTKNARRIAQETHERAVATQKAAYAAKLRRLQQTFDPPLSNAELSAGLELRVPVEGAIGISDVGRFVSESHRLRRARPDGETRALIDAVLAGDLFFASRESSEPGGRRPVLVCEALDVPWLERLWDVRSLGGRTIPPRRAPSGRQDWDSADVWDLFDDPPAPTPPTPQGALRAIAGRFVPPIGLGAMRLSTHGRPDGSAAVALLVQALDAGVRLLDTADSYCIDHDDVGHNERLIRRALDSWAGNRDEVLVATKGGMIRPGGRWMPNGRPEHLIAAAEASVKALGVEAIDLYQLHAPHRGVPFADSVGALARLREAGTIRHVGLCNVSVEQLEEALEIVPITSVQNKANPFAQVAFKSGLVEACARAGVPFIAYSPVGGPRDVKRTRKDKALREVGERHGVSPHRVALAWLLAMSPGIVAIPGCTRQETLFDCLAAPSLTLEDDDWAVLDTRLKWARPVREATRTAFAAALPDEVVLLSGSPAAGKTSRVDTYTRRGYLRLNRDSVGGTLDGLLKPLRKALAEGPRHVVLDNTYPTIKSRSGVVAAARTAGVTVRVEHIDIPRGEAMFNACKRMVERHGRLLGPDEMKIQSRTDPNMFPPAAITRFFQILEPPTLAEGFAGVDMVPFQRRPTGDRRALILDYDGTLRTTREGAPPFPIVPDDVVVLPGRTEKLQAYVDAGWLLLGVSNQSGIASGALTPEAARACFDRTNDLLGHDIDVRWCPHPAGPIRCWCRKPMPGLGVALIHEFGLDRSACLYVGDMTTDRTFAANVGMPFALADEFFATAEGPDPLTEAEPR
jgi:HAD superfamily hydrolase (TIGR01662 family)